MRRAAPLSARDSYPQGGTGIFQRQPRQEWPKARGKLPLNPARKAAGCANDCEDEWSDLNREATTPSWHGQ